jgi:hypothetical protein
VETVSSKLKPIPPGVGAHKPWAQLVPLAVETWILFLDTSMERLPSVKRILGSTGSTGSKDIIFYEFFFVSSFT